MRAAIAAATIGMLAAAAAAQPAPKIERAKQLYEAATREMADGKFADAARDYTDAYQLTRDPVLFYKIAVANEKAGDCDVALIYYGRYVHDAHPKPEFVELAKTRIAACGGDPRSAQAGGGDEPVKPALVEPEPQPQLPTPPAQSAQATQPAQPTPIEEKKEPPTTSEEKKETLAKAHGGNAAWLMVGGALTFITTGSVLAYATSSSEQDVRDLYVGLGGLPPTYNATTAKHYQDLIDEGHRYEDLAWASFAVAGACAITAAILFETGPSEHKLAVTPIASPHTGGIASAIRF